jgi:hypothetical protein
MAPVSSPLRVRLTVLFDDDVPAAADALLAALKPSRLRGAETAESITPSTDDERGDEAAD